MGDGLRFVGLTHKDQGLQVQKMFVKGNDVKLAHPGHVDLEVPFLFIKRNESLQNDLCFIS